MFSNSLSGRKLVKFLYTHPSTKMFDATLHKIHHHKKFTHFNIDEIYVFLLLYAPKFMEKNKFNNNQKREDIGRGQSKITLIEDKNSLKNKFIDILSKAPTLTLKNFEIPVYIPFLAVFKDSIRKKKISYIVDNSYSTFVQKSLYLFEQRKKTLFDKHGNKEYYQSSDIKMKPKSSYKKGFIARLKDKKYFKAHPLLKNIHKLIYANYLFRLDDCAAPCLHKIIPFSQSSLNLKNKNYATSFSTILYYQSTIFSEYPNEESFVKHILFLSKKCQDKKSALFLFNYICGYKFQYNQLFISKIIRNKNLSKKIFDNNKLLFPNITQNDFWEQQFSIENPNFPDYQHLYNIFSEATTPSENIKNLRLTDLFFNVEKIINIEQKYDDLFVFDFLFENNLCDPNTIFILLNSYDEKSIKHLLTIPTISASISLFMKNIQKYLHHINILLNKSILIFLSENQWKPTLSEINCFRHHINQTLQNEHYNKSPIILEKIKILNILLNAEELELSIPYNENSQKFTKF